MNNTGLVLLSILSRKWRNTGSQEDSHCACAQADDWSARPGKGRLIKYNCLQVSIYHASRVFYLIMWPCVLFMCTWPYTCFPVTTC